MFILPFRYDVGNDKFIDLMELKLMMEKLGAPQTHISLKNMIKEVDEDNDSMISFREVSTGLYVLQIKCEFRLLNCFF